MSDAEDDASDQWEEFEGPRGGEGWVHRPTDVRVYQDERPDFDPRSRDWEVEPGQRRRQLVILENVRDYIKERSREEDQTISEFLADLFPDDWGTVYHGYNQDDLVYLKVTPDVDKMIDRMAGPRMDKGEVIAYYALLDAATNGDDTAAEMFEDEVPRAIWSQLEDQ